MSGADGSRAEEGANQGPIHPLSPGAVITAVFPRMMGKRRPGLVLAVIPEQGRPATVVAAPLTSSRKGRGVRLAMPALSGRTAGPDGGAQGWLLPHMTAALPPGMVSAPVAQAEPEMLGAALRAVEDVFGARWRVSHPPLSATTRRPRLLRREKRRRSAF